MAANTGADALIAALKATWYLSALLTSIEYSCSLNCVPVIARFPLRHGN